MTQSIQTITFWENVAGTRWGRYVSEIERRIILEAQLLTGKPGVALEVGCEGGRWSKLLYDLGWQMVCVDINPETLAVCRQRLPQAKCILSSPQDRTLPVEPNSIDLLLCVEVAPVIEGDWFLPEANRVLRNGGILVCVLLNKTSARGLIHTRKNRVRGITSDYYKISYNAWKNDLCRNGFQPVREEGFCWGPFSRSSNSPLIPLFTKLEKGLGLRRLPAFSPWIAVIAQKGSRDAHANSLKQSVSSHS